MLDRIQSFLNDMETDVAMESYELGRKLKLVSVKVSSGFKAFLSKLTNWIRTKKKSNPDDAATEAFGSSKTSVAKGQRAACEWILQHRDEIIHTYNGTNVFVDIRNKTPETELGKYLIDSIKRNNIWQREIPLMVFGFGNPKTNDIVQVAMLRSSWDDNQHIATVGFITLGLKMPLKELHEGLSAGTIKEFDVDLVYNEVWNALRPDVVLASGGKVIVLCSGKFAFT